MDKKQYPLTVALSMLTGLVGGVVSSWLFVGTPVFAQRSGVAEVIRAERFEVVDQDGKVRAVLDTIPVTGEPVLSLMAKYGKGGAFLDLMLNGEPHMVFRNKNGEDRAVLGLNSDGEPLLRFTDKNGKVIWSAP